MREMASSIPQPKPRCGTLTKEVTVSKDFEIKSKATNVSIKELQNKDNQQWKMNEEPVKQNSSLNGYNDELRRENNLSVGICFQDQDSRTTVSDNMTGSQLQDSVIYENISIHQYMDECNIDKNDSSQEIEGTPVSCSSG